MDKPAYGSDEYLAAMRPYRDWHVVFGKCLHRRACDDPTRSEIPPQVGNGGWCRECNDYRIIGTVTPPAHSA